MNGELKGIVITKKSGDSNLINIKHWLFSQKVKFEEYRLPTGEDNSTVMIVAAVDRRTETIFRLTFRSSPEKVNVYC